MIAIFPRLAECAQSGDTEKLACMVRQYFGGDGTFAPILNVREIYRGIGLPIESSPISGTSALLGKDEKGQFSLTAFLSSTVALNKEEESFTLAYLLGHYFFHIQHKIMRGEWAVSGVKETVSPQMRYAVHGTKASESKDRICDQFAVCLLLPMAMVKRAVEKFQSVAQMAEFFGVDQRVLTRRLLELNLTLPDLESIEVAKKAAPVQNKEEAESKLPLRGLERIRAIARSLDKGI